MDPSHGVVIDVSPGWSVAESVAEPWETIRDCPALKERQNPEIEQVVLLLVLVLEKSRYLSVTLMQRNGARRFGPCFDAQSQRFVAA
jgi:hypothetical protein